MASPSPGVSRCSVTRTPSTTAVLPDADQQANRAGIALRRDRSDHDGDRLAVPARPVHRHRFATWCRAGRCRARRCGRRAGRCRNVRLPALRRTSPAAARGRGRGIASRVASCMIAISPNAKIATPGEDHGGAQRATAPDQSSRVSIDPRHGVTVDQRGGQVHQQHREREPVRVAAPAADDPDEDADAGAVPEPAAIRWLRPTRGLSR